MISRDTGRKSAPGLYRGVGESRYRSFHRNYAGRKYDGKDAPRDERWMRLFVIAGVVLETASVPHSSLNTVAFRGIESNPHDVGQTSGLTKVGYQG